MLIKCQKTQAYVINLNSNLKSTKFIRKFLKFWNKSVEIFLIKNSACTAPKFLKKKIYTKISFFFIWFWWENNESSLEYIFFLFNDVFNWLKMF